jgi:hypothetical protein
MKYWILETKVDGKWRPISVETSLKRLKANAPYHQSPSRMRKFQYIGSMLNQDKTKLFFGDPLYAPKPDRR